MSEIIFIFTPLDRTGRPPIDRGERLMSQYIDSLVSPIRRPMNYESIGRNAFSVQPLFAGATSTYATALQATFNSRPNDPFESAESRRNRQRFLPRQNTNDTYAAPQPAPINQIARMNSDELALAAENARQDIQREEDMRIFDVLLSIADTTSPDGVDLEVLSTSEGVPEGESCYHGGMTTSAGLFPTAGFIT